ncbi:MAG: serine hydrolase [Flavobacteriaceae bacterium]|nr:serine hydrolase [Flavobacteriaceae bacterium]
MKALGIVFLFFTTALSFGQTSSPAIAFPISGIEIDGDLNDWPADIRQYQIIEIFDDVNRAADDFAPSFSVAYQDGGTSLFIALEVVDSDHLVVPQGKDGKRDTVTLYVDLSHNTKGGSNILFTVGDGGFRDLFKRSPDFDAIHSEFDWDDVTVAVSRKGSTTIYEWKIDIGRDFKLMHPIGIDFFITDQDTDQEEGALAVWTPQFGKSLGSMRLGEVLPAKKSADLAWVEGHVIVADTLVGTIERIKLSNTQRPDLWFQTSVDSTGYYKTELPEGTYRVTPTFALNLDLYSSGYDQPVRPVQPLKEVLVRVGKETKAPDLVLGTIRRPTFTSLAYGALRDDEPNFKEIDRFIKQYQDFYGIPGITVSLIKSGEVVYNLNRGVKNTISGEKVTDKTLYEGASTTKTLFAFIVLRLAERGIIDLDRPLLEYLPFPLIEKDERSKLITARIVLNHQTGLSNWPYPSKFGGPGGWMNGPDITLNFEPGTQFGYSGAAFNYLGRVVAHLTGKTVSQLFEEEVAKPFGMEHTYFTFDRSQLPYLASGHYQNLPAYKDRTDVDSPASSVMTQAQDFSKFVLGLMREEHMNQDSYKSIYSPFTALSSEQRMYDRSWPQGVANGFFVQETPNGDKIIGHGGNNGDFNCKYAYILGENTGYVVFTNNNLGENFVRDLEMYLFRGIVE